MNDNVNRNTTEAPGSVPLSEVEETANTGGTSTSLSTSTSSTGTASTLGVGGTALGERSGQSPE
jgi:hypothetical protein